MPMYKKMPVEIEARCLLPDLAEDIAQWCGGLLIEEIDALDPDKKFVGINIPTLEGTMRASEGDYVIKGVQGEFYPCKPSIFHATYEEADATSPVVETSNDFPHSPSCGTHYHHHGRECSAMCPTCRGTDGTFFKND